MSLDRFPHLAQRLFNVPLALHPAKAEVVMAALADRFGLTRLLRPTGETVILAESTLAVEAEAEERYYEVVAGVAIIPVEGTLVQKSGYMRPYSGLTGYDGISANIAQALDDPSVKAIALDIDSPGGEVAGLFGLVDAIFAARGQKPIHAILTENAFSAAYAIASAADRILVPRTGGVGSIGVIAMLVDFSRALDAGGITVNLITFGKRKADGNEFQPLPKEARERFQRDIDFMGELFVETVARNRGLAASAVRDTEAATFLGAEGVKLGLADAVMEPGEAFAALADLVA